jgi:ubiquinone/menaquinone biosynthesis C-methylase UbiE
MTASESVNAGVWRSRKVLGLFAARSGFIDEGERAVIARLLEHAAGGAVLDIGVGAGRTTSLIEPRSAGYVGVDFLPEVVELARERHPGARIERADARELSSFPDASFSAALFSYNGIDGLSHEDRTAVLLAVRRVLCAGGLFAYSTHNLDHPCAGLAPWRRAWWDLDNGPRAVFTYAARLPTAAWAWRRLRRFTVRGEGWAVLVGSGYNFSVLWHHATRAEALDELARAGYAPGVEVLDDRGAPLAEDRDTHDSWWLYLLARTPGG